jgi:hypothetical protein
LSAIARASAGAFIAVSHELALAVRACRHSRSLALAHDYRTIQRSGSTWNGQGA